MSEVARTEYDPAILLAQEELLEFAQESIESVGQGRSIRFQLPETPVDDIAQDLEDIGFEKHIELPFELDGFRIKQRPEAALLLSYDFDEVAKPEPRHESELTDSMTARFAECSLLLPFSGVTKSGVLFGAEHWLSLSTETNAEPPYIGSGIDLTTFHSIRTDETIPIVTPRRCALDLAKIFVKLSAKYYEANR